jgi:hypothetical protein
MLAGMCKNPRADIDGDVHEAVLREIPELHDNAAKGSLRHEAAARLQSVMTQKWGS